MRVISTEVGQELPPVQAGAEILNSSVSSLEEWSLCARFLTTQFSTFPSSLPVNCLISLGPVILLGSYVSLFCDLLYKGCTGYHMDSVGQDWRRGKVFGTFRNPPLLEYFPSWAPGVWNTACITFFDTVLTISMNGETVLKTRLSGELEPGANIVLMGHPLGGDVPMGFVGSVTDVNLWDRVLTQQEMWDWQTCESQETGGEPLIRWKTAELSVRGLTEREIERSQTCHRSIGRRYLAFNTEKNFKDTVKFCASVGGKMAVVEDRETYQLINQTFSLLGHGLGQTRFYSGHHRNPSGRWVDVHTGSEMMFGDWNKGQPQSIGDCSEYEARPGLLSTTNCLIARSPVCVMKEDHTNLYLSGVCSQCYIDRFYVIVDAFQLLGMTRNRIVFSRRFDEKWQQTVRWEIVDSEDTVIAFMNSSSFFPLGARTWYFLDHQCRDPGSPFRTLSLHLDLPQPGMFCCHDGHCLDSDLVCNSFRDCQDGSDERDCEIVKLPEFGYNKNLPAVQNSNKEVKDSFLYINVTFIVLELFDISETDSSFDIKFLLHLVWFDENLSFRFLKNSEKRNVISNTSINSIWKPDVLFEDIKEETKNEYIKYFVTKKASPRLANDEVTEVYDGKTNPLNYVMKKRMIFICSSESSNYPFGERNCSLKFYLNGVDNDLCELRPSFVDQGPGSLGQFVIKDWTTDYQQDSVSETKFVMITMRLSRKFYVIFLATYLPTILMNTINQGTGKYLPSFSLYCITQ